jgi:hypothetical protein
MADRNCDMCCNYVYDEDIDGYICLVNMDEDDFLKFVVSGNDKCPFFRLDDEYSVVRKQN